MNQHTATRGERWSALEKMILLKAHAAGKKPSEVYRERLLLYPQRSWHAIVRMWEVLELGQQQTTPKSPNKVWTTEEKQQFGAYLRRYSFSKTPEEIAAQWQVHKNTVIKWQKRLNVRPTRKQVMAMQASRQKQVRGRRLQRRALLLKAAMWRKRTYRTLVEWAQKLRQREYPPEEQCCHTCRISWPKRKKFFRFNEYHTAVGTQRWYRKDCVLCEYDKRNARKHKATGEINDSLLPR